MTQKLHPVSVSAAQAFVEEQNKVTMPYLEGCAVRARFQQRLTELYDYPKYSCPYKRGSRYPTDSRPEPQLEPQGLRSLVLVTVERLRFPLQTKTFNPTLLQQKETMSDHQVRSSDLR